MRRPTLKDVAREAGVSIATINRIVAGNSIVRESTARKVAEAAARIGYHRSNLIDLQTRPDLPEIRLGVVLQKERQAFYRDFGARLVLAASAVQRARIMLSVTYATSAAPGDMAKTLRSLRGRVDAVGAVSVNHASVTEAVAELKADGVPCFALLSDFAQGIRKSYIGTSNLKVGRGAANAICMTSPPGKVALFVGGNRWQGHELRETGFHAHFREAGQEFEVLDTQFNLDTRQLTYEATLGLLARHRDIVGIYLAGGGMEGAIAALREEKQPHEVSLVVNEWTPDSRIAMAEGYVTLVIGTPLDGLCSRLVNMVVDLHEAPDQTVPELVFLDPVLHLPEFF